MSGILNKIKEFSKTSHFVAKYLENGSFVTLPCILINFHDFRQKIDLIKEQSPCPSVLLAQTKPEGFSPRVL